ncbi:MAG: hypothetical protein WCJ70_00070 [bacterium]
MPETCKLSLFLVQSKYGMNKESLIAIVLGLVFGVLVATGVVYMSIRRQQSLQAKNQVATSSATLVPTVAPPAIVVMPSLELTAPSSGSLTEAKTIAIQGTTANKSLVIVMSPIITKTLKLATSTFSIDMPLALGENAITVYSYPENGSTPVQKSVYIYRIAPSL